jgi:hypothetical protein
MGTASTKENIEKKGIDIIGLNKNIDNLNQKIIDVCKKTIEEIQRRKYNDETEICKRIVWSNVDELAAFLPITKIPVQTSFGTVEMRYKPGLAPSDNLKSVLDQKINRNVKCKEISRLYNLKISILKQLITKLGEKCSSMKDTKYQNLENKIKQYYKTGSTNETDTKRWLITYQNLEAINKKTINNFNTILKLLSNIRDSKTEKDVNAYFLSINKTLGDNVKLCEEHKKYFEQFPTKPIPAEPQVSQPQSPKPQSPKPPPTQSPKPQVSSTQSPKSPKTPVKGMRELFSTNSPSQTKPVKTKPLPTPPPETKL